MAEITKEQAVQLAREAWNDDSEPIPEWLSALAESLFKLCRNAGLEEAKHACENANHDESAHYNIYEHGSTERSAWNEGTISCAAVIESLKDPS